MPYPLESVITVLLTQLNMISAHSRFFSNENAKTPPPKQTVTSW